MTEILKNCFGSLFNELSIAEANQREKYADAVDIEDTDQAAKAMIAARTKIKQIRKWSEELCRIRDEIVDYYGEHESKPDITPKNATKTRSGAPRSSLYRPSPARKGSSKADRSSRLSVGKRIKKLRDALGITQNDFAAKIGETRHGFRKIETGKEKPTNSQLQKIAQALGVTVKFIFSKYFVSPFKDEYEDGLGERIAKIRLERGMSDRNLACASGVYVDVINDIENGNNFPAPVFLSRIADALNVEKAELLYSPRL